MGKKKLELPGLSFTDEEYRKYVTRENKDDLINDLIKYEESVDLPFRFDLGNENEFKFALDIVIRSNDIENYEYVKKFKNKVKGE